MNSQSMEEIAKNQMRLTTSIQTVRLLILQAGPFKGNVRNLEVRNYIYFQNSTSILFYNNFVIFLTGHDESGSSLNRGNFIEILKYKAEGNNELASAILNNAPQNAKYVASTIQKEILHILINKVRNMICNEIRGRTFCILVDKSQDESKREQMALVLRYVKHDGLLAKRFLASWVLKIPQH